MLSTLLCTLSNLPKKKKNHEVGSYKLSQQICVLDIWFNPGTPNKYINYL